MREKDVIVRFSGDHDKVKEAFSDIFERAHALGLIGEDLYINKVPEKVEKGKLKNKSASDIMAKVSGSEATVEAFIEEVVSAVSESLSLDAPSTGLKLLTKNENEKDE